MLLMCMVFMCVGEDSFIVPPKCWNIFLTTLLPAFCNCDDTHSVTFVSSSLNP